MGNSSSSRSVRSNHSRSSFYKTHHGQDSPVESPVSPVSAPSLVAQDNGTPLIHRLSGVPSIYQTPPGSYRDERRSISPSDSSSAVTARTSSTLDEERMIDDDRKFSSPELHVSTASEWETESGTETSSEKELDIGADMQLETPTQAHVYMSLPIAQPEEETIPEDSIPAPTTTFDEVQTLNLEEEDPKVSLQDSHGSITDLVINEQVPFVEENKHEEQPKAPEEYSEQQLDRPVSHHEAVVAARHEYAHPPPSPPLNHQPWTRGLNIDGCTFVIVNVMTQTALDVSGGDKKTVIGFPKHGDINQQWRVERLEAGYTIRSVSVSSENGKGGYLSMKAVPGAGGVANATFCVTDFPMPWDVCAAIDQTPPVLMATINWPGAELSLMIPSGKPGAEVCLESNNHPDLRQLFILYPVHIPETPLPSGNPATQLSANEKEAQRPTQVIQPQKTTRQSESESETSPVETTSTCVSEIEVDGMRTTTTTVTTTTTKTITTVTNVTTTVRTPMVIQ